MRDKDREAIIRIEEMLRDIGNSHQGRAPELRVQVHATMQLIKMLSEVLQTMDAERM